MQDRSATWIANQAEILSAPSELVSTVESLEPVAGADPISRRWIVGNPKIINNLVEARLELPFDPTRTTLPIQSSTVKIENATNYNVGLPPVESYDFAQDANMRALGFPTTIDGELGFRYSDGGVERLPAFRHSLTDATIDDFNTYLTLNGESFLSQLDKGVFYGGRYDAAGIDAATVIAEILEDVTFKGEGGWNYVIGAENCKVSSTLPLWADSGFDYWIIDPELARFKLFIPVPPVSHRQALQYVAAYVGADVWVNRNGQIVISRGLYSGDAPDYTLDIGRVYDRPKRIRPLVIGAVESKLAQYNYETSTSEIANVTVVVPAGDSGETKLYRLTHDACHDGALVLTGATLVGTPTYYTYSTEFLASSTNATFTADLTGKKVELVERVVTFPFVEGGATATYSNPIASDVTHLHSAIHEYVRMVTAPQYEIAMRDDPAIDNGDRLNLQQVQNEAETPVIVGNISREMSGALDAKYTLYENRNRYVEDFSALDDTETVIGYEGWVSSNPLASATKTAIGGTRSAIVVTTRDAEISRPMDLRLGTPLHFAFGGMGVMALTSLSLATLGLGLPSYDNPSKDRFHVDVGSGSTWTRIASNVAGTTHSDGTHVTYWACPGVTINPTDAIRVTIEGVSESNAVYWTRTATTPALGATKLDAAQWTFTRSIHWDDYTYYDSDTSVTGISYSTTWFEAEATLTDFVGATISRIRLEDDTCQVFDGSTWGTIATGLTPGYLNEIVFDTHAWTISVNGGTPVACEPLTLPVYPIGELKFEMTIGSEMYFGEIQYE